jgi:hypothetical protein
MLYGLNSDDGVSESNNGEGRLSALSAAQRVLARAGKTAFCSTKSTMPAIHCTDMIYG